MSELIDELFKAIAKVDSCVRQLVVATEELGTLAHQIMQRFGSAEKPPVPKTVEVTEVDLDKLPWTPTKQGTGEWVPKQACEAFWNVILNRCGGKLQRNGYVYRVYGADRPAIYRFPAKKAEVKKSEVA